LLECWALYVHAGVHTTPGVKKSAICLTAAALGLGACGGSQLDADTRPPGPLEGSVARRDGAPVGGATITVGDRSTVSADDGSFSLAGLARGARLATVTLPGERPHAVPIAVGAGGAPARLVIPDAPAPGEVDLWLAGDVMFSRRYIDPDGDGDTGDALVPRARAAEGAAAVLRHVSPLMKDADLAVINLETVVADAGMIHPRKPYTLRSEPGILDALVDSGVGLVGLANNHVYDYTDDGLTRMLELVDEVGLPRVGAGRDWNEAVEPHIVERNGLKIAFIAATSITGRPYITDGEGDGDGDGFEGDDLPPYYTADPPWETAGQPKVGALRLDADNIREGQRRAEAAGADVTVLLMHGGTQYSRSESPYLRRVAHFAIDNGVDLVVGHHPHVIQGIEVYRGVPIFYSVGNLAFDQQFIETFPALVVEARLTRSGVEQAAARPIFLDGFQPRALAGDDAVRVLRDVAARSAELGAALEIDAGAGRAVVRGFREVAAERTLELSGAVLPNGRTLPLRIGDGLDFVTAVRAEGALAVDLARPLLVNGDFDDALADDVDLPAGWNIVGREKRVIRDGDEPAVLHVAKGGNSVEDSTVRSTGRMPIVAGRRLTLTGRWSRDPDAGQALARLALFADRETGSTPVAVAEVRGATSEWTQFSVDLIAPAGALYAQVQLVHAPPTRGDAGHVMFTDIELLEWTGPAAAGEVMASGATHAAIDRGAPGTTAAAILELASTPKVKP
jgi:poly-gamma-glutamate capsule biosynthesis protein CapA/YwtB (metallophosphatase superfamily)